MALLGEYEKQLMEFSAYRWHKMLLLFLPPFIVAVGTIGNTLSVVTLTRKPMRRYSTFSYLAILAVADTVVVYVGLFRLWIAELTGVDVRDLSDWSCKLITFFNFTASDYSGWLVVAVTVERWLAVARPLSAPRFCSRARAYKVSVLLLLALGAVNMHFLWTVQLIDFRQGGILIKSECYYSEAVMGVAWPWFDAFLYSFIPFVVIITLNALIIRQVIRAKKERVKLRAEGIRSVPPSPLVSDRWRLRLSQHGSSLSAPPTPTASHVGLLTSPAPIVTEESGKITAMLLTISFAFLICTLPMNVTLIVSKLLPGGAGLNEMEKLSRAVTFKLVRTVLELLMYTNHAINFYLYVASGTRFRSHVLWMLRGAYRRRSAERSSGGQKGADSSQLLHAWPSPGAGAGGAGAGDCSLPLMSCFKHSAQKRGAETDNVLNDKLHQQRGLLKQAGGESRTLHQEHQQQLMNALLAQSRRCSL